MRPDLATLFIHYNTLTIPNNLRKSLITEIKPLRLSYLYSFSFSFCSYVIMNVKHESNFQFVIIISISTCSSTDKDRETVETQRGASGNKTNWNSLCQILVKQSFVAASYVFLFLDNYYHTIYHCAFITIYYISSWK